MVLWNVNYSNINIQWINNTHILVIHWKNTTHTQEVQ